MVDLHVYMCRSCWILVLFLVGLGVAVCRLSSSLRLSSRPPGVFVSKQKGDSDMGSKVPKDILVKGKYTSAKA